MKRQFVYELKRIFLPLIVFTAIYYGLNTLLGLLTGIGA